ncbi:heparan-alpha-glucosaminide N-acetyltransferase domain-containing protein [Chitinophaga horti]|uniref:Heparan-alpha-glucosaminide N-acetyltransferase domain-containing protein n=1 Tax=Chitinophaga horti TaxID=2920382 RepID=A0ABY6IZ12_9BACT|nr:heparan-alpha-glucosaminide N-acetyltransferase domain-containing protein [Chitinophaga horti]UYQ92416.1 heparan-alpha-glucosaminide N-acetyltransferase domain-containing protein [Chitinophaga horti]
MSLPTSSPNRFLSLDVFRGLTVACMILVNTPGSWAHIYAPLGHAKWHGWTPTDLVFPFFLFAVGNAMSFALKKYDAPLAKIFKRTALIFLIGLLLNWFPFVAWSGDELVFKSLAKLRIMGVLQRIALCYGLAALIIYYFKPKGAIIASVLLLLGYWGLLLTCGQGDPYSLEGNAGLFIDKAILGENHMYRGEGVPFDPEGLLSTLPAIVNVICGYLAGDYIQRKGKNTGTVIRLALAGLVFVALAYVWNSWFPINKKIWTSSYVLLSAGLAAVILSIFIYLVEIVQWKRGWYFFEVFGKNPLFIFVMSGVLVKIYGLIRPEPGKGFYSWFYETVFRPLAGELNGSLLFALFHVGLFWLLGWWLDKKRIYIKV